MRLAELQKKIATSIQSETSDVALLEELVPGGRLPSAADAFSVYQAGYPSRLTEALGEAYEGVWSVLGDELFFATCKKFISTQPSETYNLSAYHSRFSQFLAKQEGISGEFPFLPELAEFEWAFHQMFHRSQEVISSPPPEKLAEIDGNSRFKFPNNLQLFKFQFSSYSVWRRKSLSAEEQGPIDVKQPEYVALYKLDSDLLKTLPLSAPSYYIFKALLGGKSLESALDQAGQALGQPLEESAVSETFSVLLSNNLISEIE